MRIRFVSLVVPAYRQEKTILKNIDFLERALSKLPYKYEIIVVLDGFEDQYKNLKKINNPHIRVIGYKINQGKGFAVKHGVKAARGDVIGFIDAGNDIDPTGIDMLLSHMAWYDADIILGSKLHPVSQVRYSSLRKILSWGYRSINRFLFRLNVRDTQSGIKFYRREVAKKVFPKIVVKKFAFEIEVLAVANAMGYKRIYEAPIRLTYNLGSITSRNFIKTSILMLWDTLSVFYRLKVLNYYEKIGAQERKPKLLILNWRDPLNPASGGAEKLNLAILEPLIKKGYEVVWYAKKIKGRPAREKYRDIEIIRYGNSLTHLLFFPVFLLRQKFGQVDLVFDCIHGIGYLTPIFMPRTRRKVLIYEVAQNIWDEMASFPLNKVGKFLESLMFKFYGSEKFWTISKSTQQDLVKFGVKRENITILPMGFDAVKVKSPKYQEPTALFVGRLVEMKGIKEAIRAVALNNLNSKVKWNLRVVGKGEEKYEDELREMIKEFRMRRYVKLLGSLDEKRKFLEMAKAWVLLVPSSREGWGMIVPEANFAGTQVVGYESPGLIDSLPIYSKKNKIVNSSPEGLARTLESIKTPVIIKDKVVPGWQKLQKFVDGLEL